MKTAKGFAKTRTALVVLAACGLTALSAAGPVAAQPSAVAPSGAAEATIGVGKSQVVELPGPYTNVMIGDPKIADVLPLTNHSVYVVGKSIGSTSLSFYGPGQRLLNAVNVVVSADLESLKARLNEAMPDEKNISVRAANQSILVSGTVGSPVALAQVLALADSYAPGKVINMMGVQGTQQVMLSVRFVEMERTTAKDLQADLQSVGPTTGTPSPQFLISSGDSFNSGSNILTNLFGAASLRLSRGKGSLDLIFDALETKGLTKTLAEPNLVTMSGDTASFLAGGEFPIPVQQASNNGTGGPTLTVEFKQFGVSLAFTPTILKDGLINLVVNPEVSEIDPTTSVSTGGIVIPGIKVRRAHATLELRDGESFTVAGLLKDTYANQIRQFPFIGDLPVLGALFRSTGYQRGETELMIVVTPHLVTPRRGPTATPIDHFIPPSDFELFLFGGQESTGIGLRPEDRVLMSSDPTKGGIDGPHGHVLF